VKFCCKYQQQASGRFMMFWQTQLKDHSEASVTAARHWDPWDPDSSEDDRSGSVLTNPAIREWQNGNNFSHMILVLLVQYKLSKSK
jgi:hypothetical protein